MTQTEDEDAYRVITALHLSRKFLTVATYYELTNSIILDNFPSSKTEMQNITDFIKSVTATTNFIFSATILSNKDLLDLLVGENPPIPYQSIKSSCWQESNAKEFILRSLRVRSSHYGDCETNIMIYLSQVCDIECQETIQTLGALAYYLSKNIFQLDQDRITISSISPFPRDSLLRMDQNTYRSLQIFKEDFHPNWIRGKGKSKEGFSIFAMFDRTLTSPGRRNLYEWMKSPTYALNVIVSRQEDVDFFLRNDQQDTTNKLSEHLRHTADMPHLMMKMMKASMNPIDWCKLQRTLKEWIAILEITYEQVIPFISNESNILRTFSGKSVQDTVVILSTLINTIDCILDIAQCERENSIVIVRGYNDILDLKKEKYEAIEQELIRAAELILKYTPPLQNLSVEYIPQLGFHVVVDADNWKQLYSNNCIFEPSTQPNEESNVRPVSRDGEDVDPVQAFRFSFFRDDRYYLKHHIVDQMDNEIGDIKSEILDLQKQCLLDLEEIIVNQEVFIYYVSSCFATLDATLSLSLVAREYKLIRPAISDENVLVIKSGRHLLQELTVETFVPNDSFSSQDKNISIITGPNGSGKSIYLKQIGIITYLAHIGSFVPCERAVIGLTDRIFTRISSDESVSVGQSAFTIDLCQMAKMFRGATQASLCLIDEFGKGTMPMDGMSLLGAVLKHFVHMPCRSFCVLHLSEVLDASVLPSDLLQRINCFKMDTLAGNSHPHKNRTHDSQFGNDEDSEDEEMIPLYKLRVGRDSDSEGISCAKTMGIDNQVIARAKEIKSAIKKNEKVPVRAHLRKLSEIELQFMRNLLRSEETGEQET